MFLNWLQMEWYRICTAVELMKMLEILAVLWVGIRCSMIQKEQQIYIQTFSEPWKIKHYRLFVPVKHTKRVVVYSSYRYKHYKCICERTNSKILQRILHWQMHLNKLWWLLQIFYFGYVESINFWTFATFFLYGFVYHSPKHIYIRIFLHFFLATEDLE